MAALKNHQTAGAGFGNEIEYRRVRYDYSKDGGATGALDILTADGPILIVHAHARVVDAVTSTGSATLKWGPSADDDRFMTVGQGAKANLTDEACIVPIAVEGTPNVLPLPYAMASGAKLVQTIGTEVLSGGVVEYVIGIVKV